MTKRISQANTVVVPASEAHAVGAAVAAVKAVAVPAEAEIVANTKDAVAAAPVEAVVVAEPVIALVSPAPLAMVAEPVAAAEPAAATAVAADDASGGGDYTPYIVGGVLLAGGILAVALSGGDDKSTPAPAPTPTPTNTVTFSSAATATVAENVPTTTTIIDVNAAATQAGAITYTLGGADAALFNIDASTGVVTLKASPNFEAKASYAISVTAASAGTPAASATQAITVTITNVNEAPVFATATATGTVAENAPVSTIIFDANATDPDAGTTLIYSLSGADAALLNINSATGEVTLKASADFETKAVYNFNVVASDAATGGLSATQAVTVNVTDVPEGPPAVTINLDTATAAVSGLGAGGAAQATTFTDNTTVLSNATINNFGADDKVVFSGTTTVQFSSNDNDLTIAFNNAGVVNKIVINDIVSPNAIITNEATAEAAVNAFLGTTGGDYFRFA